MMENIRTAANNIVVKIIFGLIILSFIFAGVGGIFTAGSNDDKQYIAKVDGEGLSRATFENAARAEIQRNNLNSDQTNLIKAVRRNVLNQQIESFLVYKFADTMNIKISNEQVKNGIRQNPAFFKDGLFSNALFLSKIAQAGYPSADVYAEYLRQEMRLSQLFTALQLSDFVLPAESDIVRLKDQTRTILTAPLVAHDFGIADRTFTDDELYSYYQSHQEQFTASSDLVKLETVRLPRSTIEAAINVTDADVKAYYQQHKKEYAEPAQYAYSSIETSNLDEAKVIHQSLVDGSDFATLASEKGLYPLQRKSKGFLGWFSGNELPEMIKQANLTNIGDFSQPLEQSNGHYLIVKLDNERGEKELAMDMIIEQVRTDMIQDIADERLHAAETKMQELVASGLSLSEIAKQMKLEKEDSDWLNQNAAPLSFSAVGELVMQQLDDNHPRDQVLGPVYVDEIANLYVVQITDHRPAGLASFDSVKSDILSLLQAQDRTMRFQLAANEFVEKLNAQDKESKAKLTESKEQTVSRDDKELDKNVLNTAFSLVPSINGNPVYGIAYLSNDRAVVTTLVNVEYTNQDRDIQDELSTQWVSSSSKGIVNTLLSQAKIEIMPDDGL